MANLDAIEATVAELGWRCDFERTGGLTVATEPHQAQAIDGLPSFLDATSAPPASTLPPTSPAPTTRRVRR